jgi:hypothetical protein
MKAPCTRFAAAVAVLLMITAAMPPLYAQEPPPEGAPPPAQGVAPPPPPGESAAPPQDQSGDRTPPRLSFTNGDVSFWRLGAEDWTPAQINMPLAPGDALYAGAGASLELQIAPRGYARAGANTQLGLENQEPDFLQFKVTAGHASLDLRSLKAGQTVEFDTPNAAFTIEASGYYRLDITEDTATFITRRGGRAVMTPAGGAAASIASSEEVVVHGTDNPSVETYVAPPLEAWDRWNYDRTDHLIDAVSARYVPQNVYGVDALDHYGSWRVTPDYGAVWVPEVAADWAPYSAGRWVWDPYYAWTWVDDAPWGWAPCHYGRWVHPGGYWAWAPGPVLGAPVYAPALVAFFGGPHFGVSLGIGAPAVGWVALGWGEPLVPWWGRPGFIGVPSWRGWGGPRIVNNVVIERNAVVDVTTIREYQNVRVRNGVVAVREDRFGRGVAEHVRVREIDPHHLEPLHGSIPVRPVAASLTPRQGRAVRPPDAILRRSVIATRAPHDTAAALRAEGLNVENRSAAASRIVQGPHEHGVATVPRAPFGQHGTTERPRPPLPPAFSEPHEAQPRQQEFNQAPAARQAPPPQARAPAAQPERAPGNLPGESANRMYRAQPQMQGSRAGAAVAPRPNTGAARGNGPRGRRTR